ncbi:hypothetical protein [Moorena sp. SIO3H5]|nr:hypothetical protein [Moorena sp. SIO3H5]
MQRGLGGLPHERLHQDKDKQCRSLLLRIAIYILILLSIAL